MSRKVEYEIETLDACWQKGYIYFKSLLKFLKKNKQTDYRVTAFYITYKNENGWHSENTDKFVHGTSRDFIKHHKRMLKLHKQFIRTGK